MEDTLEAQQNNEEECIQCLNPCFNGRYSRSDDGEILIAYEPEVLILVLMEDTLEE